MTAFAATGKTRFLDSELREHGSDLLHADLDGDQLQDLVLVASNHLSIFYQDASKGFRREPDQELPLEKEPALICPAKLGRSAASLLLLRSDGVTELSFTNSAGPVTERQIIKQQTLIPGVLDAQTPFMRFPFVALTKDSWPLILLPVDGGLQVWRHHESWQVVQLLSDSLRTRLWPSLRKPGYTQILNLDLSLDDLNGDGRDDLLAGRSEPDGAYSYRFRRQTDDEQFEPEPAMTHTEKPDQDSWLCWMDLNRDGQLDLIKSISTGQPWFLPGEQSGKVVVCIYLADAQGRLPIKPTRVFRKNDAMPKVPVADVDGNGYADIVLGSAPFDTREGLRKMIVAKQLVLTLKFHFYRPDTGYLAAPDCQAKAVFQMDRRTFYLGPPPREFFENVVNLDGDFDGDGKRDLLIKDRGDQLSAHAFVSRERGFTSGTTHRFDCGALIKSFEITDLNGDGVSDLIVRTLKPDTFRIFTSRP